MAINNRHRLEQFDVVGGKTMSAVEWVQVRQDDWELRKARVMLQWARLHCGYTLIALRVCVPIALSQTLEELPEEIRSSDYLPISPLFKQRRMARISWRYADEYRKGSSGNAVVRAVASQSSTRHRDTSRMRQSEAAMEAASFEA
jgi:hypothetical protein